MTDGRTAGHGEGTWRAGRARPVTPAPSFRVTNGALTGVILAVDQPTVTVGRRADNDLVVDDPTVSRLHARVTVEAGAVIVTDLGSTGGVRVNGATVAGPVVVHHGDRVAFGAVATCFENPHEFLAVEEPTVVFAAPALDTGPLLSARQLQVLELVAEGLTNRQIGGQLNITERTVKAYTGEIYRKLDVGNRAAAVAAAIAHGLL